MTGILTDNINTAADEVADPQSLAAATMSSGFYFIPQRSIGKPFNNFIGMRKIPAKYFQQPQSLGQICDAGIFAQCHGARRQMQPTWIRQQLIKKQPMKGFAADFLQVLRPGLNN